jgi:hypothetical protein
MVKAAIAEALASEYGKEVKNAIGHEGHSQTTVKFRSSIKF